MNNAKLIWVPPNDHERVWKNAIAPPQILLTALQPRSIDEWRTKNRWAESIDMIIFTDDTPPRAVLQLYKCSSFHEQTRLAPHMVVNAPASSIRSLDALAHETYDNPVKAYAAAVRCVARSLQKTRCVWIQPESDHATGALNLASVIGMALAYSQRGMIDTLGALAAGHLGVDVKTLGSLQAGRMMH